MAGCVISLSLVRFGTQHNESSAVIRGDFRLGRAKTQAQK
jgi:hypothetical protein